MDQAQVPETTGPAGEALSARRIPFQPRQIGDRHRALSRCLHDSATSTVKLASRIGTTSNPQVQINSFGPDGPGLKDASNAIHVLLKTCSCRHSPNWGSSGTSLECRYSVYIAHIRLPSGLTVREPFDSRMGVRGGVLQSWDMALAASAALGLAEGDPWNMGIFRPAERRMVAEACEAPGRSTTRWPRCGPARPVSGEATGGMSVSWSARGRGCCRAAGASPSPTCARRRTSAR
jgi:hypothetical protein